MTDTPGVADHAAPTVTIPAVAPQPSPFLESVLTDVEQVAATTIEPKVLGATAAGAGSAAVVTPAVLWLIGVVVHGPIPAQVTALVGLIVTGACTFVGGYLSRHVDRVPPAA